MQIRKIKNFHNGLDFYMVGGMGYASSVALGASLRKKKIICLKKFTNRWLRRLI